METKVNPERTCGTHAIILLNVHKVSSNVFDVFPSTEESSSSDEEFAVDSDNEEAQEKLMEAINQKKKLIASLRTQPWSMRKKLSVLRSIT